MAESSQFPPRARIKVHNSVTSLRVPHIELEKIENFAKAKVKETILAVTGG
jgi:hypothetical protein